MAVETTQISADISVETKASLENTLRRMGVKKAFVIEAGRATPFAGIERTSC